MSRISSADICGLMRYGRRSFKMVVTGDRSLHHIWRGDYWGPVTNPAIKWSLNVPIDVFASLALCMFDRASWSWDFFLRKYFLTIEGHFLSMMWIFGFIPLFLNCVWSFVIAANCSANPLLFNASDRIALESWQYTIMVYLCHLVDVTRNIPVCLLKTYPLICITLV